jgi:hypothetical protein
MLLRSLVLYRASSTLGNTRTILALRRIIVPQAQSSAFSPVVMARVTWSPVHAGHNTERYRQDRSYWPQSLRIERPGCHAARWLQFRPLWFERPYSVTGGATH